MKSALAKLVLACLFLGTALLGQGCVQCATSAHGAGVQGERALFRGMLVLLIPSLTILTGLGVLVYRNRDAGM